MNTKNKNNNETTAGHEIGSIINGAEPIKLEFAFLRISVQMLSEAAKREARRAARKAGGNKNKPKYDYEKLAVELAVRGLVGWEHKDDGGALLVNGEKLTPGNAEDARTLITAPGLVGLGEFIIENTTSADKMYHTLDEEEIKN